MCIRTVLTYASPVFAHAAPKALDRFQVIQNKFCRDATDAHWGKFLVGFSPTLLACTGARMCVMLFLPPPRRKREKKYLKGARLQHSFISLYFTAILQSPRKPAPLISSFVALEYGFLVVWVEIMNNEDFQLIEFSTRLTYGCCNPAAMIFVCFSPCEGKGGEKPAMGSPCARAHGACPTRTD
ncbi:hypothetical protein EVAR_77164_1 [Eumeta japonica]|uniref:Uncharacterized protein n=1 Tax=Eumeta variegata TaxID=151549 RepID=A0A4C1T226_EUMVA|nr:hypothetical protein EVAR_77164_1 [Eumeta japonica]